MKLPFRIDLGGKTAVVTGAGGVLCSAFAEALASCGAKVALLDLNKDAAERVAAGITAAGGTARAYACNALQRDDMEKAHGKVLAELGPCDILINGAGGNHPKATTTKEYYFPGDKELKEITTFFLWIPRAWALCST